MDQVVNLILHEIPAFARLEVMQILEGIANMCIVIFMGCIAKLSLSFTVCLLMICKGFRGISLQRGVIAEQCTLPTAQTIHNRILSKVCCDGFTRGIRNTCSNQYNILL